MKTAFLKKTTIVVFLVILLFVSKSSYALTKSTLMGWGTETLDMLREEFQLSNGFYAYTPDETSVTYAWGHGIMLGAIVAAAAVDDSYIAEAEKLAKDIQSGFWCSDGGGYNASKGNCGDRYSDDSAWIVLAMIELYEITNDSRYLEWAQAGCEYIMSCENDENTAPYGGIRWHEGDTCGTRMCSTSPACLVNMKLYLATGDWSYVQAGYRLYLWAKENGAQNTTTGLYYEGVGCSNEVDTVQLGYDTAPMLEAIIIMYEISGNIVYLNEAQQIAHNMVSKFVNGSTHALKQTGKWCGHDMTNAFVHLYEVDGNYYWIDVAAGYIEYMYNNCKADSGLFNISWDNTTGSGSTDIIDNASPARAFWTLARCYGGVAPSGSVAICTDCSYSGSVVYLDCGEYSKDDLQFYGIGDNSISSLKVASGYTVKLYDNSDFSGSTLTCTSDKSCLSDYSWNDKASSLVIEHSCSSVEMASRVKINDSDWHGINDITVQVGDSVLISPLPEDDAGVWSWAGTNGMRFSNREFECPAIVSDYAGRYRVKYISTCGKVTYLSVTLNVVNPVPVPAERSNLALGKDVWANGNINGEGPEMAVDGTVDSNSKWCVNTGTSTVDWLKVDLGDIYEVDTFVVQHAAAGGESISWNTSDYAIYTSLNGNTWNLAVDVQGNTKNVTRDTITPVLAQYVKLEVSDPAQNDNAAVRIYEFEVYGPYLSHCLVADTTGVSGISDCKVDLYDFKFMADYWLSCDALNDGICTDYIDIDDLDIFVGSWLECLGNGCP